jgi:6-pyruvoyltetrahydropterin/6-carboxytetrahydropterin synthase
MRIRKQYKFEAAHVLPWHPGKCARLHGHSYRLDVTLNGPLQEEGPSRGMVVDFDAISQIVEREIVAVLDHRSLNDFLENPTAEAIACWIWRRISPHLDRLEELTLWETATACAILRRDDVEAGIVASQ